MGADLSDFSPNLRGGSETREVGMLYTRKFDQLPLARMVPGEAPSTMRAVRSGAAGCRAVVAEQEGMIRRSGLPLRDRGTRQN